jgi:hypothetical protein
LFSISINLTDSAGSFILSTSVGDSLAARCIVAVVSSGRPDVANQRKLLGIFQAGDGGQAAASETFFGAIIHWWMMAALVFDGREGFWGGIRKCPTAH